MNVFVSTWVKFPGVSHNQIVKILSENLDEGFCSKLKRNQNTKRRPFNDYYDKDSNIGEIKTKTGQTKLLVSDCCTSDKTKQKIMCWYCREKPGAMGNGIPIHIEEIKEDFEIEAGDIQRYGYFCDESCMYAFVEERCIPGSSQYQLYKRALFNAELLHKLTYPDRGCIRAANPWQLLKSNGGTLDYDMWKDETLSFQPLPGFILTRISTQYLQS